LVDCCAGWLLGSAFHGGGGSCRELDFELGDRNLLSRAHDIDNIPLATLQLHMRGHTAWVAALAPSPTNPHELASVRQFATCDVRRAACCCCNFFFSVDAQLRREW
jgi:hypothetical protein